MSWAPFLCLNCCPSFWCGDAQLTFRMHIPALLTGTGVISGASGFPRAPPRPALEEDVTRPERARLQLGWTSPLCPRTPSPAGRLPAPPHQQLRAGLCCVALRPPVSGRRGISPLPGTASVTAPAGCLQGPSLFCCVVFPFLIDLWGCFTSSGSQPFVGYTHRQNHFLVVWVAPDCFPWG